MKLSLTFLSLLFISSSVFAGGEQSLQELMNQRLALKAQLVLSMSQVDAAKIKAQITALRYKEAQLGEKLSGNQTRGLDDKSPSAFTLGQNTILNPTESSINFQSGDLLVVRGQSIISTIIANFTDTPSQFSHSFLIYKDPADGVMYAVEALMDKGVIVHPFQEVLDEGMAHLVLYRYQDPELANAAAKYDYDRAKAAIAAGKPLQYANSLLLTNYDRVTCAEECREGFDIISNGAVKLPMFESTIGGKFPNLMKSFGLPSRVLTVQWPYDFDSDPRLKEIAESRDFERTFISRSRDQVILSLLTWLEQGVVGQDFSKYVAFMKAKAQAPLPSGASPADSPLAKLGLFSNYADKVVDSIVQELLAVNRLQVQKAGRNLSQDEISQHLESIRTSPLVEGILRASGFEPAGLCRQLF